MCCFFYTTKSSIFIYTFLQQIAHVTCRIQLKTKYNSIMKVIGFVIVRFVSDYKLCIINTFDDENQTNLIAYI